MQMSETSMATRGPKTELSSSARGDSAAASRNRLAKLAFQELRSASAGPFQILPQRPPVQIDSKSGLQAKSAARPPSRPSSAMRPNRQYDEVGPY